MTRAALLALAVLLAGCPALGGSGQPTVTPTPAPVPADPSYPPGVDEAGVVDPADLARAHAAVVRNQSYTLVSNRTIRSATGDLRSLLAIHLELADDRTYLVSARTAGPDGPEFLGRPPASAEIWSNGSVYVSARPGLDGRTVREFDPPNEYVASWRYWRGTVAFGGQAGFARESLGGLFASIPTELVDTRRTNGTTTDGTTNGTTTAVTTNGTTVFRLVGESATSARFAKVGSGPVGNVSLAATVTEQGVVRSFDLAYDRRVDGELVQVRWSLRYERVGSTGVPRPDWIAAVGERPSPQNSSVSVTSTSS